MTVRAMPGPCGAGYPRRRRGQALESAITEAVLALLSEIGYEAVTMEGVAARARTGKAALYRRWASKADLGVDVPERRLAPMDDLPEHGKARAELLDELPGLSE